MGCYFVFLLVSKIPAGHKISFFWGRELHHWWRLGCAYFQIEITKPSGKEWAFA